MNAGYVEPLNAAYLRMKAALFRPFNLEKWFVIGFASWISGWGARGGFNFNVPRNWNGDKDSSSSDGFKSFLQGLSAIWADPVWQAVIIASGLLLVALGIVILWINSRGEFVFLDGVLNGRRAIAEPWRAYRAQGNSLFVWQLVVSLVMLTAFVTLSAIVVFLSCGGRIPRSGAEIPWLRLAIGFGLTWLPFAVVGAYIQLFLHHFVTPIMFRDRVTTMEAWRTFLPLLGERIGAFVLYGVFVFVVHVGLFLALIPAVILTCCLLGCLLLIPYIGAVVWLPVSYGFRALGPEFLAQFGPGFNVWPVPAIVPAAAPEMTPEVPPETPPEVSP